jgi:sodium/potassium/calcium exchanger 6
VISAKRPKASLAVAELLGGGIFVTTCVIATIIFVKPFKVAGLPFLRDAGFYLLALCWLTFVMLFDKQLFIWQPIVFIILYIIYVATVFLTRFYYTRIKKKEEHERRATRISSKISGKKENLILIFLFFRTKCRFG